MDDAGGLVPEAQKHSNAAIELKSIGEWEQALRHHERSAFLYQLAIQNCSDANAIRSLNLLSIQERRRADELHGYILNHPIAAASHDDNDNDSTNDSVSEVADALASTQYIDLPSSTSSALVDRNEYNLPARDDSLILPHGSDGVQQQTEFSTTLRSTTVERSMMEDEKEDQPPFDFENVAGSSEIASTTGDRSKSNLPLSIADMQWKFWTSVDKLLEMLPSTAEVANAVGIGQSAPVKSGEGSLQEDDFVLVGNAETSGSGRARSLFSSENKQEDRERRWRELVERLLSENNSLKQQLLGVASENKRLCDSICYIKQEVVKQKHAQQSQSAYWGNASAANMISASSKSEREKALERKIELLMRQTFLLERKLIAAESRIRSVSPAGGFKSLNSSSFVSPNRSVAPLRFASHSPILKTSSSKVPKPPNAATTPATAILSSSTSSLEEEEEKVKPIHAVMGTASRENITPPFTSSDEKEEKDLT